MEPQKQNRLALYIAIVFGLLCGIVAWIAESHAQLYGFTNVITPAAPTGSANTTTGLMSGLGADTAGAGANKCQITIQKTGSVLFLWNFVGANSTAADGFAYQMFYGTGTAPANGAANTGTSLGAFMGPTNSGTTQQVSGIEGVARGLAVTNPPTVYWFDLSLKAITGGTASLTNVLCQAIELAN